MMQDTDIPRFSQGFRLRYDRVRQKWVILAPERVFFVDRIAVEILELIDGATPLAAIIDRLAQCFGAPRDMIATDGFSILDDLAAKGVRRA